VVPLRGRAFCSFGEEQTGARFLESVGNQFRRRSMAATFFDFNEFAAAIKFSPQYSAPDRRH